MTYPEFPDREVGQSFPGACDAGALAPGLLLPHPFPAVTASEWRPGCGEHQAATSTHVWWRDKSVLLAALVGGSCAFPMVAKKRQALRRAHCMADGSFPCLLTWRARHPTSDPSEAAAGIVPRPGSQGLRMRLERSCLEWGLLHASAQPSDVPGGSACVAAAFLLCVHAHSTLAPRFPALGSLHARLSVRACRHLPWVPRSAGMQVG